MVNRTLDPADRSKQSERTPLTRDPRSIGPSDSSDSGSDLAGQDVGESDLWADGELTDTDQQGTGERLTVGDEPDVRIGSDIGLDRIVGAEEAGLGGGLDQAEEAQLGITDEEIEELARTRSPKK